MDLLLSCSSDSNSGLSLLALGFDGVFLVQHFVLYRDSTWTLLDDVRDEVEDEEDMPSNLERERLLPSRPNV